MSQSLRLLLTVGVALIGAALLLPSLSGAQDEPPLPISTHAGEFGGSVTINGEPAPDGTPIEALIDGLVCGDTETIDGLYNTIVRAGFGSGREFQEGCGAGGDDVLFRSGELIAAEVGQFVGQVYTELDLTFADLPEEPDPAESEEPSPPQFPDTGYGSAGGSGTPIPPWLLWALSATGIAAIGAAAIARGRVVQG